MARLLFNINSHQDISQLARSKEPPQDLRHSVEPSPSHDYEIGTLEVTPAKTLTRRFPATHYATDLSERQECRAPSAPIFKDYFDIDVLNSFSVVFGTEHEYGLSALKLDFHQRVTGHRAQSAS
jgi:hypothetical protein